VILTDDEDELLVFLEHIESRTPFYRQQTDGDVIMQDGKEVELQPQEMGKKPRGPGPRQKDRRERCCQALTIWRRNRWELDYGDCIWGPTVLMPDAVLNKFATQARICTVEDIKTEIPEWVFATKYGSQVLAVLQPLDAEWNEERERQKEENKRKRALASAEAKVIRKEKRREAKRIATAQRNAAQATGPSNEAFRPTFPSPSQPFYNPFQHPYLVVQPHTYTYPQPPAYYTYYQSYPPSYLPPGN
jgi:hypothetical protein